MNKFNYTIYRLTCSSRLTYSSIRPLPFSDIVNTSKTVLRKYEHYAVFILLNVDELVQKSTTYTKTKNTFPDYFS